MEPPGVRSSFRRGAQKAAPTPFAAASLPRADKEALCRQLLSEFGVASVTVRGDELVHACCLPGHDDRNPSAQLNVSKLTYMCFACGRSGGLLWLVGMCRGSSTVDARSWLGQHTGEEAQDLSVLLDWFDAIYSPARNVAPPCPKLHPAVLEPWLAIHPYLVEVRRCPVTTLQRYLVGYDPVAQRVVVPHFWRGDLVGWQTRRLVDDGTPKWRSSVDFPKAQTVFSYDQTRPKVVAVESPMSVLRHAHHLPMEATFGATVTDRQIQLLAAHPRVVLWFDNDRAGWDATRKVGDALAPYTRVYVVDSPYAADAGDMGEELAEALVAEAVPYALWRQPNTLRELADA